MLVETIFSTKFITEISVVNMEVSFWEAFLLNLLVDNCFTSGSIAVFGAISENVKVTGVFFLNVVEFHLID